MKDYEPLNLSASCNVGPAFFPDQPAPLTGKQTFHGLPFLIGPGVTRKSAKPRRCFVGLHGPGGSRKPVTIPVGATARYVIFAHTLLDSHIHGGAPVGEVVAHYVFHLADDSAIRVPIRDRFEIASVPLNWGQLPFVALPDRIDHLQPRHQGFFGNVGTRQTEAAQAWPHSYYLWAWANPKPEVPIDAITIEPAGRKLLVAGITLSRLQEYPFCTTARREVKITLPRKADAAKPFNLTVDVDRGVATYPYALPAQAPRVFVNDDFKGWGQTLNDKASPAYVHVAANPSATLTIKNDGQPLAKVNWGDLEAKGKVKTPRAAVEIVDTGRNWVHTAVLDDATGQPTPCRIHFRSLRGIPSQPHGHHDHVFSNMNSWHVDIGGDLRLGQITYAYIDGKCQGWLPRGEIIVDVGKGFEYQPLRQIVDIQPGQRELTLCLQRCAHMNNDGWYSGDTHVHFLGERGAHREAQGEDLNVVNLLASQWGHLFTNTEDFIGRPTASDDGKTIVYCSQENRQHLLGHLTLLGLKEPVSPWCSDGPAEAEMGGNLEVTLSHWADACHAQGGTVVIPHLPNPNAEPATLIATGRADAVEMLVHSKYNHLEYYHYLNCGYKLPLVGGTDKMTSDVPVGICRTYARIQPGEPFNYENWCAALRQGRTFLSSGPLLRFTVNGAEVGDTIDLPGNGGTLEVEARADSIFPIHALQIVQQGNVVASTGEKKGARTLHLKANLKIDRHTWLAARCAGPNYTARSHHDGWSRGIFAHTSPIYVAVGGPWWLFDQAAAQYMLTLIDGSLQYIRRHARHHHDEGTVTHHHTHHDHRAFLESPFHEAAAAIHKRMHELGITH